jgi:hypothetical protein
MRAHARAGRFLGLFLALAALAACGGEPEEPAGESAPALSPTEAQPDRPRLDAAAVTVVERARLEAQGRWEDARAALRDADGRIYVLDAVAPSRILRFEPDGGGMLRFGEGEDDPGSTVVARDMSLGAPWNTILMVDRANQILSAYLTLGMSTYTVEVKGGVPIHALARPQFGEYYLHAWDQVRSQAGVYQMRLPIDTLAVTYQVAIPLQAPVRKIMRDIYFHVTTDAQGRLYVAFQDAYPVRVLEADGTTVRLQGVERAAVARSAERLARETEEALAKLRREAPDIPDSLLMDAARPDSLLPLIEELDVDPQGRLWARTHRADVSGGTSYDVFDAEGGFLARVEVPGEVRATSFGPDGALVVVEGAAEAPGTVVTYEVRLGG